MFLIDSIGLFFQSAVTLYIYRVGKTYPARNPVYRSKSIKNPSCTRILLGLVRPLRLTGQTSRPCRIGYSKHRPVRLPGMTGQTGWSRLLPILVVNTTKAYLFNPGSYMKTIKRFISLPNCYIAVRFHPLSSR